MALRAQARGSSAARRAGGSASRHVGRAGASPRAGPRRALPAGVRVAPVGPPPAPRRRDGGGEGGRGGGGGGGESGGDEGGGSGEGPRRRPPPSSAETFREFLRGALQAVDDAGAWTPLSSLTALGVFLLKTYNMSQLGGWDVLYRDDIDFWNGGLLLPMSELDQIDSVLAGLFFGEFVVRAYAAGFAPSHFTQFSTLIDFLACLPAVLPLVLGDGAIDDTTLRLLPIFRVLRLLRLTVRQGDSLLFGFVSSDDAGIQLVGLIVEFVCIFVISAGIIFDLEVGENENVHGLGDTLYWAFLTLTGIGQPFEVVTPGGKVTTVISVLVALLVLPGQIGKLLAVSGSTMLNDMMDMDEEDERGSNGTQTATGVSSLAMGARGGRARRAGESIVSRMRYRRTAVERRPCGTCNLAFHDADAQFCKSCGSELPQVPAAKAAAASAGRTT